MEHVLHPMSHPEAIDPTEVDWDRVQRSKFLVHQRFHYAYPANIRDLRHQLMVIPPATFGDQNRTIYSLEVSEPGEVITTFDSLANTVIDVRIPHVEREIEFEAWVTLERSGPPMPRILPAEWLRDPRLLEATPRTARDPAIVRAAAEIGASGARGLALADRINEWVYDTMTYVPNVTGVHTPASAVLDLKQGVCQDYAHLMLAICRELGLPSLYVSGHLIGVGGTHAWVEVLVPASDGSGKAEGWSLDPTHRRRANLTYLTVAVGRDYGDVAPTSGSYRAGHGGSLTAFKEVRVTEVTYTT